VNQKDEYVREARKAEKTGDGDRKREAKRENE
jgi:hypothetical protein